jgi:hypothetical protein
LIIDGTNINILNDVLIIDGTNINIATIVSMAMSQLGTSMAASPADDDTIDNASMMAYP